MLRVNGNKIRMDEGDYGLFLPFKISGDVLATDKIEFRIKDNSYSDLILKKDFTDLVEEDGKFVFKLSFTKEESDKLKEGTYHYGIKQYRDDVLLNTIVEDETFKVDKGV